VDRAASAFRVNPPAADIPRLCAVLNGFGRRYHVDAYTTTLSLKTVAVGAAVYRTPQGAHRIEPGQALVLNHGQRYALDFVDDRRTETLAVFFAPGFLEGAAGARARLERLLERPDARGGTAFVERVLPQGARLGGLLAGLRAGLGRNDRDGWLEDRFHDLADALLDLRDGARREEDAMPARRAATRAELYRRLHRARDYADACLAEPLRVADLAAVACLSPFHFQRAFRAAFGASPMRYLQRRRLEAARRLLVETDRPVTEVCAAVGFQSLGSFGWLFRRHFGLSPRDARRGG
jgi:AraC-like DNA-binding protein